MCLLEQTLNARTLTPLSDTPEGLESMTPNLFASGRPVVAETLMPFSQLCELPKDICSGSSLISDDLEQMGHELLPNWKVRLEGVKDKNCGLSFRDII